MHTVRERLTQCSARAEKLLRSKFAEMEDKVFVKVKNTIIVDATSAKRRDVAEKEFMLKKV